MAIYPCRLYRRPHRRVRTIAIVRNRLRIQSRFFLSATFAYSLKTSRLVKKTSIAKAALVFRLSRKGYKSLVVFRTSKAKNKHVLKKIILISSYNSRSIKQDLNYFYLDKSELAKFGLVLREDNSFNEIILCLLLLWESKLESSRISVISYRYLQLAEQNQWVERKSVLVNFLVLPSDSKKGFPSPRLFSI